MQPIIIQDAISVSANTTVDNIIVSNPSLRQYLRAPFQAAGKFLAVGSAAGLRVDLSYGSQNVVSDSDIRAGTDLQEPLDVLNDHWFPAEGDQLVLRVVNTTGGALTLRYRIQLDPPPPGTQQIPPDARVMQRFNTITAGAVDTIVTDGLKYERPPVDSMMSLFATASATGLTHRVNVQMDNIAPPSSVAPLNRVPQDPFDMQVSGVEAPRDQLVQVLVSNPTGGNLTYFWRIKLNELIRT